MRYVTAVFICSAARFFLHLLLDSEGVRKFGLVHIVTRRSRVFPMLRDSIHLSEWSSDTDAQSDSVRGVSEVQYAQLTPEA
jgi:hypothetical protein